MDIEVRGLGKQFLRKTESFWAIRNLDLVIPERQFVCVVGPTGCGKTTLLRLLAGLERPTKGEITVGDVEPEQARDLGHFSFVFQNPTLLPWRTVLSNVELPAEIRSGQFDCPMKLLRLVGLKEFAHFYPAELSGGMKQRVALARALSYRPAVLLMDEPFGALDELTRQRLNEELLEIVRARQVTVIFVTHSIEEAVFLGNAVVVLTAAPARLKQEFPIHFSAQRSLNLRSTRAFQDKVREIREHLS